MAYSTQSDLEKRISKERLLEMSDDDNVGDFSTRVTAIIDRAIEDADADIDGYLEKAGYTVPLSAVPKIIRKLSVDMAAWNLRTRRPDADEDKTLKGRYESAIGVLEGIRDGAISIGTSEDPGEQQIKTNRTTEDLLFTLGKKSDGSSGTLDDY